MPSRHGSFLAPSGAGRHTPDPVLAARAWVPSSFSAWLSWGLRGSSPGPAVPGGSAGPENRVLRGPGTAGKVRAARWAAAGRREGHVPSQSERTPASHRPPSLHRLLRGLPGTGLRAGPREHLPTMPVRVLRVPAVSPVPGTSQEAPTGFRPPSQCPQSPASSKPTGKGRETTAPRPVAPSRAAPPELVQWPAPAATHRPPVTPNPVRLRQAEAARARSSPATRPGPSSPPGPAVYTGSDVSGPAPPPTPSGGRCGCGPSDSERNPSCASGAGAAPKSPSLGTKDLRIGQVGRGLRIGCRNLQGYPNLPL